MRWRRFAGSRLWQGIEHAGCDEASCRTRRQARTENDEEDRDIMNQQFGIRREKPFRLRPQGFFPSTNALNTRY